MCRRLVGIVLVAALLCLAGAATAAPALALGTPPQSCFAGLGVPGRCPTQNPDPPRYMAGTYLGELHDSPHTVKVGDVVTSTVDTNGPFFGVTTTGGWNPPGRKLNYPGAAAVAVYTCTWKVTSGTAGALAGGYEGGWSVDQETLCSAAGCAPSGDYMHVAPQACPFSLHGTRRTGKARVGTASCDPTLKLDAADPTPISALSTTPFDLRATVLTGDRPLQAAAVSAQLEPAVYSDYPEYVADSTQVAPGVTVGARAEGVLYAEQGSTFAARFGRPHFRVYFNHENRTNVAKEICVVLSAPGPGETAEGIAENTGDPVGAGRGALSSYERSRRAGQSSSIAISTTISQPGQPTRVIPVRALCPKSTSLPAADSNGNPVVNGILDFTDTGQLGVQVAVVVLDQADVKRFSADPVDYRFAARAHPKGNPARTLATGTPLFNGQLRRLLRRHDPDHGYPSGSGAGAAQRSRPPVSPAPTPGPT